MILILDQKFKLAQASEFLKKKYIHDLITKKEQYLSNKVVYFNGNVFMPLAINVIF